MTELIVATLNLRNRQDRWRERRWLVVEQLAAEEPDLISLQEISLPIRQGAWLRDQLNLRLTRSERGPYRLVQQPKRHLLEGWKEGIGVLTKRPLLARDTLPLGYRGRVALRVNIDLPDRRTLDFVAVHLHHVATDRQARLEQVMALMAWLNSTGRVPLQVVAGDFNEVPDGPAIQQIKQQFRSAFAEHVGREPLATCPTALPRHQDGWAGCLDYIFLSPAVGPVRQARLCCNRPAPNDDTLYPSDHVGIVARITL